MSSNVVSEVSTPVRGGDHSQMNSVYNTPVAARVEAAVAAIFEDSPAAGGGARAASPQQTPDAPSIVNTPARGPEEHPAVSSDSPFDEVVPDLRDPGAPGRGRLDSDSDSDPSASSSRPVSPVAPPLNEDAARSLFGTV